MRMFPETAARCGGGCLTYLPVQSIDGFQSNRLSGDGGTVEGRTL